MRSASHVPDDDRFCEQAKTGEAIVAQGKVEHVTDTRTGSEHYG